MQEDFSVFFDPKDFGTEAILTTQAGDLPIAGILDENAAEAFGGFGNGKTRPFTTNACGLPAIKAGDTLTINSVVWRIFKPPVPGEPGMVVIELEPT